MNYYLTKETAKQLKDWGCDLKSEKTHQIQFALQHFWTIGNTGYGLDAKDLSDVDCKEYNAYHILEDVCVKYAKEFFGEEERVVIVETCNFAHHEIEKKYLPGHTAYLIDFIQQNKKQEAEKYLLKHTIFNPKNI